MKKMISLVVLCLAIGACSKKSSNEESASNSIEPDYSVEEPIKTGGVTDPPPTAAYTFGVNIVFINTSSAEQAKFDKAVEMIKRVVASERFKTSILNHKYGGKLTYVDNGGLSNSKIYQKMLDGAEKLYPQKNNAMDLEVELYYEDNTTVGYTYPNSKRVWVNKKYFDKNAISSVAANLMHEWLHKIGFGHAVEYSSARDYSVPYAIGRMVKNLGPNL